MFQSHAVAEDALRNGCWQELCILILARVFRGRRLIEGYARWTVEGARNLVTRTGAIVTAVKFHLLGIATLHTVLALRSTEFRWALAHVERQAISTVLTARRTDS